MGFGSFFKKLGKGLLKVAPIAASFIPGVGPLAGMAIGGLASGASKKLSGGSWKDALVSGGIGAGVGALGGAANAASKGIGPSSSGLTKLLAGSGKVGKVASGIGKAMGVTGGKPGWQNLIGPGIQAIGGALANRGGGGDSIDQNSTLGGGAMNYGGIGPSTGFPDIAGALRRGKNEAIRNQPFRQGYDVTTTFDDDTPPVVNRMPPIYPNRPQRRQRMGMQ